MATDERDTPSVGDRIRILRQRRGLTQVTLAAMCGRGEDWIKRIENPTQTRSTPEDRAARAGVGEPSGTVQNQIKHPVTFEEVRRS